MAKCSRDTCPGKAVQRGLCRLHWDHWRRNNPPVPAGPVSEHVDELRAAGLGYRRIEQLTGVPRRTVWNIHRQKYVYATTAAALLALPVPAIPHNVAFAKTRVPAVGTVRRLQALTAIGYTGRRLAQELNYCSAHIPNLICGHTQWVTAGTARRADELFRTLQLTPAPPSRGATWARNRARRRRWAPPLAWDEDTIDDPHAQPFDVSAAAKRKMLNDFADIVADHRELGHSDAEIATAFGVTRDAVQQRMLRHGIARDCPPSGRAAS